MCCPQDEAKVGEEMTWEQCDDVQSEGAGKFGAKTRFFVSKCRFTRFTATLRSAVQFARTRSPNPESPMSRRQLTIVVLSLATSLVATACGTAPTAPSHDAPIVVVGSGG